MEFGLHRLEEKDRGGNYTYEGEKRVVVKDYVMGGRTSTFYAGLYISYPGGLVCSADDFFR